MLLYFWVSCTKKPSKMSILIRKVLAIRPSVFSSLLKC